MPDELLVTAARSRLSGVPGRSLNSARTNHFIIDEPTYAGGPGEAPTPAESFLSGVSSCGVLLMESFARQEGLELEGVEASIEGIRLKGDPANFREVRLRFEIRGTDAKRAEALVERFKAR
jgi:uncharacterized OsmC-like protein